jgi:chaperonin cofactor prefoldin
MTNFPELKIEDTRRTNELTLNSQPFAICIMNPEPAVRAFFIKVFNNTDAISNDYNIVKKTGALLDQNTKNILRVTLKNNSELFKKHLEIDYSRWYKTQERFGLLAGIIEKTEQQFEKTRNKNRLSI